MPTTTFIRRSLTAALLVAAVALTAPVRPSQAAPAATAVRELSIPYTAYNGETSHASVLVPASYDPQSDPPLPLVISPHGRGLDGTTNARLWGSLPALGGFAVVNADGMGLHLSGRYSWGAPGQIADLARMPAILRTELPWLRIDQKRVYAVGGSMGGQETLLLLARHPGLLAGAVAVDPMVDFPRQYRNFASRSVQGLARREVGGTPATAPAAFAARSPLTFVRGIASSATPLQIWWTRTDRVIVDSQLHSGLLVRRIRKLNPRAPLTVVVGTWQHTAVLRWDRSLPAMLVGLGLITAADA